jgi:hypothetical protein
VEKNFIVGQISFVWEKIRLFSISDNMRIIRLFYLMGITFCCEKNRITAKNIMREIHSSENLSHYEVRNLENEIFLKKLLENTF